jgi:hypothetical protein
MIINNQILVLSNKKEKTKGHLEMVAIDELCNQKFKIFCIIIGFFKKNS